MKAVSRGLIFVCG